MPDIAMCARTDCPLASKCYRHADSGTKPTPRWQSYMAFNPPGPDCPGWWPRSDRGAAF